MDVCCDLLLDDDAAALAGAHPELRANDLPAHTLALVPELLRTGLHGFSLDVRALDALENEVNDHPGGSAAVEELLRAILRPDRPWVFVFDLHCDQIDEVFPVRDVDELLDRLRANLRWDERRIGFLAHHAVPDRNDRNPATPPADR